MIRFVCPGCDCSHNANEAFGGLHARCVRCGATLVVPYENGRATLVPDQTAQHEPFPADSLPVEPTLPAFDARRRKIAIYTGGAVGALALIVGVYFLFIRTTLPPKTSSLPVEVAKEEPPPKKEEPPPPPPLPPAEVAPPPRRAIGGSMTAVRMLAERAEDPKGFDEKYTGKMLLVRGILARSERTECALNEIGEKGGDGVTCRWWAPPPPPPSVKLPPAKPTDPKQVNPKPPDSKPPEAKLLEIHVHEVKPATTTVAPGQPITIRGEYAGGLKLTECFDANVPSPADEEFRGLDIEVSGVVASVAKGKEDRFPTVVMLSTMRTDCPISIRCLFRTTQEVEVGKLQPGQRVVVRGRCGGRKFRIVRIDDCTLAPLAGPPDPSFYRISVEDLFDAFEADWLPAPRPGPEEIPSVPLTAERLAGIFQADREAANDGFRYKVVEVLGTVEKRTASTCTIAFETGTTQAYQVVATFTPDRYAILPDARKIAVRGVCMGLAGRTQVRLENAELVDEDGPDAPRTDAEFLPFVAGRSLVYNRLVPGRPKDKDHPIQRLRVSFADPDQIRVTPLMAGKFPGPSLFSDSTQRPHWLVDLVALNATTTVSQHRLRDGFIEVKQSTPTGAGEPAAWWDPVMRLGRKQGDSWTAETPEGHTVRYTVVAFSKDATGKDQVEIARVLTDPKNPDRREETAIFYVRGVGEVRRITRGLTRAGSLVVLAEMQLADPEIPAEIEKPKKKGAK